MLSFADIIGVVVTVWGIVMDCGPLFQLKRMVQTRSAHNVSLPFLTVLTIGYPSGWPMAS
ncbi:MAG: hypothetical protein EPO21_11550 [Chloroflexota bacterium]|nr:MAG: hypothetical protein EPO21_11550 [Chloroflexota bacterium]